MIKPSQLRLPRWNIAQERMRQWYFDWSSQFSGRWGTVLAGLGVVMVTSGLVGISPFLGVAASAALVVFLLVAPRPIVILFFLCLAIPLTGGLARGAAIPILRVSQALVVVGFGLMILSRRSPQGKTRLTWIDGAFILMLIASSIFPILDLMYRGESINNAENQFGQSPIQIILGPIQYYLLFRIVVSVITTPGVQIKTVLNLTFIASIIVSVLGIMQKAGFGPIKNFLETYYPVPTHGYEIDEDAQRITSTLQHYAGLGAYLAFTIIIALACYCYQEKLKFSPVLLMATLMLDSIALLLTGTFAAWGGLAIGAVVVFVLARRVPKVMIFVVIGMGVGAIFFSSFITGRLDEQVGEGASDSIIPQSMVFRIRLWQETFIPAVLKRPIFGAGPTPSTSSSWAIEESQYLFLLLRGGIVYFGAYCFLMVVAARASLRRFKARSGEADQPVAAATFAILIAINVMNIAGEFFTYVGGTQTLWMMIGIIVATNQLADMKATEEKEKPSLPSGEQFDSTSLLASRN